MELLRFFRLSRSGAHLKRAFARKLHKMGEKFLLRVLGQTDRT